MKSILKIVLPCAGLFGFATNSFAQDEGAKGRLSGNFQIMMQTYKEDTLIGAFAPDERAATNAFGNLRYTLGNFEAGLRFESYQPALLGYPARFSGSGISRRFITYRNDELEITFGNFFDQFGSGLVFRSFEENGLGIDNAMDGYRVVYRPVKGMAIKGIYGQQRFQFNGNIVNTPNLVRALDVEFAVNDLIDQELPFTLNVGGSFVSRFQSDDSPELNLPENVGAWAGRFDLYAGKFTVSGEYVQKGNDPSADNNFIYKKGQAALFNASFSQKGLGVSIGAKSTDNMSFRSDRNVGLTDLMLNFNPALTKTHTYNLAATLYPYATNLGGEVAFQGDVIYNIKKGSPIGGKYGTTVAVNYAVAYDNTKDYIDPLNDSKKQGYETGLFKTKFDSAFVKDFNIEIKRKLSKKVKVKATYFNEVFNADANIVTTAKGMIYYQIGVIDLTWKLNRKHSLRFETQGLFTKQDKQNWFTGVIEYTFSPHWFAAVIDQYNYGNKIEANRIHYLIGSVGYIKGANRVSVAYGKQREGIFCVGGVCRSVPAANGLTLSITSSF
jgi:hypothetical protein